jgi:DNA transformation protein and related proteins
MKKGRKLTELKNIGEKIASRLILVGIETETDLRRVGAVAAYQLIRKKYPNETLPLCYYLYSFEGALTDKHWDEIGDAKKAQLRSQLG